MNLCICNEAFENKYTVYKVILLVSRCCTGLRPPNNYCPPDGVLTMVAGRLSSKPLIGIRYATSSKWKKNAQDRQVGFATYVTPPISIPDNKVHGTNKGPTWVLSAPDRPHFGPMNLLSGMLHIPHPRKRVNCACTPVICCWLASVDTPNIIHCKYVYMGPW